MNEQIYIKDENILSLIKNTEEVIDTVGVYYFGKTEWENKKQEVNNSFKEN